MNTQVVMSLTKIKQIKSFQMIISGVGILSLCCQDKSMLTSDSWLCVLYYRY